MLYSVILPAHRDDDYLAEAIASVEAEMGDDDAELIIVANGPHRTAIARRHDQGAANPRRRVLQAELPSLVNAINRGIEESRGTYIARMDADDIVLPGRFKAQVARLDQGGVEFLFTKALFVDKDMTPLATRDDKWPNFPTLDFVPIHPSGMFRRDALIAIGGFGNVERAEDRHMWLAAIAHGYRFEQLPIAGICYRLHDGQITSEENKPIGMGTSVGLDLSHGLRMHRWGMVVHALTLGMARFFRATLLVYLSRKFAGRTGGLLAIDPVKREV